MLAVLFSGQGSEQPRMGIDVCAISPRARALVEGASAATGEDVARAIESFSPLLARTEVLQPALVAVCLGIWCEIASALDQTPAFFAGHSLGEICAWSAAGGITPEDAVDFAAKRGALMASAAVREPGGMTAVTGATEAELAHVLATGRAAGNLQVGAHNAPDEWVLTGDDAALRAIARAANTRRLQVAGAWHSEAMRSALDGARNALLALPARTLTSAMIMNNTGERVNADAMARLSIAAALVQPVLWAESLRTLWDHGARRFLVVGPGRATRASVRRTLGRDVLVWLADDVASIARATREITQAAR